MIKGIIFDLDGTLINSISDITYSTNLALKEFGYESKDEDYVMSKVGNGFKVLIQGVCNESLSDEKIEKITKVFAEEYAKHYCEKTCAYDGIYDVLLKLQELDIKIGVNSNKRDSYCKVLMEKIFPKINFVSVIGERSDIPNKPNPYSVKEIVKNMGLDITQVIYVGDSEVDMATSKNANMRSIGVLWGYRNKEVLKRENATYIVNKPEEIINIVEEDNRKEV